MASLPSTELLSPALVAAVASAASSSAFDALTTPFRHSGENEPSVIPDIRRPSAVKNHQLEDAPALLAEVRLSVADRHRVPSMGKRRWKSTRANLAAQLAVAKVDGDGQSTSLSPMRRAQILKAQAKVAERNGSANRSTGTDPALRVESDSPSLSNRAGKTRRRVKFVPKGK